MTDSVEQMCLTQSSTTIYEKRVIIKSRVLCDIKGSVIGKLVIFAHNEGIESISKV